MRDPGADAARRNRKWVERRHDYPNVPQTGGRCVDGKVGYPTKRDAKLMRKKMTADGLDTSAMQVFKCPVCSYFHLGNNNSGATRAQMRNNRKQKGP